MILEIALPPESAGHLWAVLLFVFYGDKVALADIEGRGLTIPSGRIEPGETLDEAAVREAWEETGANLDSARRRLIGCLPPHAPQRDSRRSDSLLPGLCC